MAGKGDDGIVPGVQYVVQHGRGVRAGISSTGDTLRRDREEEQAEDAHLPTEIRSSMSSGLTTLHKSTGPFQPLMLSSSSNLYLRI